MSCHSGWEDKRRPSQSAGAPAFSAATRGRPRQQPLFDPIAQIVYASRGDDVETTIVNGKVLMRDRKVLTLDEDEVLATARDWGTKVRAAVKR